MTNGSLRQQLYPEFARIGSALASERRLEIIDLLAQAPRNVDALSQETGMPVANVSQHLQVLRNAKLVSAEREGNKVIYRLADEQVLRLWLNLRLVGRARLPEVRQIEGSFRGDGAAGLSHDELEALMAGEKAFLIDVRPRLEYEAGHLAGAVSIPVDELAARLSEIPLDKRIVTYCRGIYCAMSDEAEAFLRQRGFDVVRLEGGWPEWWDEGRPTELT